MVFFLKIIILKILCSFVLLPPAGERFLSHDLELEDFAVPGIHNWVVLDGEEVRRGWCHVVLIIIFTWVTEDEYLSVCELG